MLLTRDITKSSADQRKGRAGREVFLTSLFLLSLIYALYRVRGSASDYTPKSPTTKCLSQANPKFSAAVSHPASWT